ncbi:MAG: hypothetical protein FWG96_04640 [Methanomassiliicoccaceae archaeon]|nr:hypothetical protein [Methanomassiliicoccaceae archaeon]
MWGKNRYGMVALSALAVLAMVLPAVSVASGEEGYADGGEGFVVTSAGLLLAPGESPLAVGAVLLMLGGSGELIWSKDIEWSGGGYSGFRWNDVHLVRSAAAVADGFIAVGELVEKYDTAGNPVWQKSFDEAGATLFFSVTGTADGFIAAGNRDGDGIIMKCDGEGTVIWEASLAAPGKRFIFQSVTVAPDGLVATGYSHDATFFDDNWSAGPRNTVIAKFNDNGTLLWSDERSMPYDATFCSVAAVPGGAVAVGGSIGNPLIVRYSNSGAVLWEKDVVGMSSVESVIAVPGGFAVVGEAYHGPTWDRDAVIAMFSDAGDIVWRKDFGGADDDSFRSVAAVEGGLIAVGYSYKGSFGNGDLAGIESKSTRDTIIVMFDDTGGAAWVQNTPWGISAIINTEPDMSGVWLWMGAFSIAFGLACGAAFLLSARRQGGHGAE